MLAQIDASPLKEVNNQIFSNNQNLPTFPTTKKQELNRSLITAEAAVRIASKKYGGQSANADGSSSEGAVWWMTRELEEKQKKYGPQKK